MSININDISFDAPVQHQLPSKQCYYMQNLKYRGDSLYIPSGWFYSNGINESIDKKPELLVPLPANCSILLKSIEDVAIRSGLKVPVELQINATNEDIFKRLPERNNLYIKLDYHAVCFDKNCKPIKIDALTMGDFRVMIHVKGLYIGHHANGKLASLQLRIAQVQNIAKVPQCMFTAVSNSSLNVIQPTIGFVSLPETPQPGVEIMPLSGNKKGRKPKLQRQNAVSESKLVKEQQKILETLPPDFFNDLDLSALQSA